MSFDYEANKRATHEAVSNPRAGDRFHEMYSFWLYVVAVVGDTVYTLEGLNFPAHGVPRKQSRAEFKTRLSYQSMPGYWVQLCDRGNDVVGWWQAAMKRIDQEAGQ